MTFFYISFIIGAIMFFVAVKVTNKFTEKKRKKDSPYRFLV